MFRLCVHKNCHSPAKLPKNYTFKPFRNYDTNKETFLKYTIILTYFLALFSCKFFCSLSRRATIR
jgi:hypothetical protein